MEKNKNEPRKHTKKNYFLPREYGEAHGDNWGNHRASFEVFQELGYCFLEKNIPKSHADGIRARGISHRD